MNTTKFRIPRVILSWLLMSLSLISLFLQWHWAYTWALSAVL